LANQKTRASRYKKNKRTIELVLDRLLDIDKPIQFTTIHNFPDSITALEMEEYAELTSVNWRVKNEEDLHEELDSAKKILRAKRRVYSINQEKQALLGTATPASIVIELEDAEKDIKRYEALIIDTKKKLITPRQELLSKIEDAMKKYASEISGANERLFEVLTKLRLAKDMAKVDASAQKAVTSAIEGLQKIVAEGNVLSRRQALLFVKTEIETTIENIDELYAEIADVLKNAAVKTDLDRFHLVEEEKNIRAPIAAAEKSLNRVIDVTKTLEKEIEELESY
jgi:hypothetical protein